MKLSIGKLSKMFAISRTALLYYDKIGLLCPTYRDDKGYRFYEDSDINRLRQIMLFRDAGLPLEQIKNLIVSEESAIVGLLMKRLGELNDEISMIKRYQRFIITILEKTFIAKNMNNLDAEKFETILKIAGIDKSHKQDWHTEFEKHSPEQHQNFLSMLGVHNK
jgi:DNA-binding transcriptional MerR regulator